MFDKEITCMLASMGGWQKGLTGCFVAGGAITSSVTGRAIRDYDLYFKDKASFTRAVEAMYDDGCWCLAITQRAITFSDHGTVFQLMCFDWFETADSIFRAFDFTVNMAAIDMDTRALHLHSDFVRDIAARNLRFNHRTAYPIASMMRVRKYLGRQYRIVDSEYLKIAIACALKGARSWEELKEQVGGQYGSALALDTGQDFTIDNAVSALDKAMAVKDGVEFQTAENAERALEIIFKASA